MRNYKFTLFWYTDVDECSEGLDNCDENANCTNLDDGFTCTCQSGYSGSGTFCSGMQFTLLYILLLTH